MFERMNLLLDSQKLDLLFDTNVLIVGVGGVGGACLEALVRLGVSNITLVDGDSFDLTNLNRQILATQNNIGNSKVLEASIRAKSINPDINIKCCEMFLNEANINELRYSQYDYIIDCCDTMTTKLLLIKKAIECNVKIISSMGTGNRLDCTKLEITNIWNTSNDPVARIMRKLLKENGIKNKIPVLCSREIPIKINSRRPGSVSLVPNVAGFYIANYIFNDIISYGSGLNE